MNIYLVIHGETEYTNEDLSIKGIEQAYKLKELISNISLSIMLLLSFKNDYSYS